MWVDERRVVHTSEPSHWTEVLKLSPSSFAALLRTPPAEIHDMLDEIEDDLFDWLDTQRIDPAVEADYTDRLPPRVTLGLAGPPAATLDVLGAQLVRQSARWRLDYLWAIRECLAELAAGVEVDPCSA
jgi:hypothetical protein